MRRRWLQEWAPRSTILDLSLERLRYLSDVMPANCVLIYSNRQNILEQIKTADLVVGAVLVTGRQGAEARAPRGSEDHAAGRGDRGRGDRPGRLRRDDPRDDAREPRRMSSTESSTTAWRTCRAVFRGRRRSRSPTRRCRTRCSWRTRAGSARSARTRPCSRD